MYKRNVLIIWAMATLFSPFGIAIAQAWTNIGPEPDCHIFSMITLDHDQSTSIDTLVVSTDAGIWRTFDSGENWTDITPEEGFDPDEPDPYRVLHCGPIYQENGSFDHWYIIAMCNRYNLFSETENIGETDWHTVHYRMANTLAISSLDGNFWIGNWAEAVYKSENRQHAWWRDTPDDYVEDDDVHISIDAPDSTIYLSSNEKTYRKRYFQDGWETVCDSTLHLTAFSRTNENDYFLFGNDAVGTALYTCTDSGETFTSLIAPLDRPVGSIVSAGEILYLSTEDSIWCYNTATLQQMVLPAPDIVTCCIASEDNTEIIVATSSSGIWRDDPSEWEWPQNTVGGNQRIVLPATMGLTAYPNPFNTMTKVCLILPASSHIRLSVYDVLGREVAILSNGVTSSGNHQFVWNPETSGVYFVRAVSDAGILSRKVVALK